MFMYTNKNIFLSKNIYRWEFNTSYSIKYLLPSLVPELAFDDLEVNNGEMAAEVYLSLLEMDNQKGIEMIRNSLLEYCKLDTLAMVRILERLKEMC